MPFFAVVMEGELSELQCLVWTKMTFYVTFNCCLGGQEYLEGNLVSPRFPVTTSVVLDENPVAWFQVVKH